MWNVFEQPWGLLFVAGLVIVGISIANIFRRGWDEGGSWLGVIFLAGVGMVFDLVARSNFLDANELIFFWQQVIGTSLAVVMYLIAIARAIFVDRSGWFKWAGIVVLIAAAFGLDVLVATDREKIDSLIESCMVAVEEEDCKTIGKFVSSSYYDSHHASKAELMSHCENILPVVLVESNKKLDAVVAISDGEAKVTLSVLTKFEPKSVVYKNYKAYILSKTELGLVKGADKRWQIERLEVVELDKQPVGWGDVRY